MATSSGLDYTSTIVYNAPAGGSCIEAAINSWGVSDEQLLNTVARRLKEKLKGDASIGWPPHVEELEQDGRPSVMTKVVQSLAQLSK